MDNIGNPGPSTSSATTNHFNVPVEPCRTWTDLPPVYKHEFEEGEAFRFRVHSCENEIAYIQMYEDPEGAEAAVLKVQKEADEASGCYLQLFGELMVGGLYLARRADDHWYRVVVKRLSVQREAVQIFYYDFGYTETIRKDLGIGFLVYDPGFYIPPPIVMPVKVVGFDVKTELSVESLLPEAQKQEFVVVTFLKKIERSQPVRGGMDLLPGYEVLMGWAGLQGPPSPDEDWDADWGAREVESDTPTGSGT